MTTPPTPAEIPKPDFQGRLIGGKRSKSWVVEPDGTTSIERFAAEQVARAEKAEKSAAALDEALCVIFDDSERFCRERDKLQAENERLREALRNQLKIVKQTRRDLKNPKCFPSMSCSYRNSADLVLKRVIKKIEALHPTTKGDEDDS